MTTTSVTFVRRAILPLALAIVVLGHGIGTAGAATPQQICGDVSKKAGRTLWSSVRESGDAMFCRKSWVPGLPDELAACGAWSISNQFGNKLKNLWNRVFSGQEWATWGARGLSVDWEEGTIRGGFKRTFFGPGLAYSKSTIEVVKEGGQAEATVTACALDYDGKVVATQQKQFANGKGGENTSVKITINSKDNRIIGVVVDTPPSVNSFEYRARMLTEPIRNDLPAVKGLADLHVHQTADLSLAGRMYWGASSGPIATALHKEEVSPAGANFSLDNLQGLAQQLSTPNTSIDANILFRVFGGGPQVDGFFQYGGEGYPSFKDWPHHADRSHQGVYLDWLKEAHERNRDTHSNLNLIVVSMVNDNVTCSIIKALDHYGNHPTYSSDGIVSGWESKNWGCSDHENVARQIEAMHAIEKANPWYRIAMNPWHARQIIADGDLAVVASMETDKPLSSEGNNYGNWENELDLYRAMGVSTFQIVHEVDSIFCGAAVHRKLLANLEVVHWPDKAIDSFLNTGHAFTLDERGWNAVPLTKEGEKLIDAMVKRNMPIDLAHTSQRCRSDVLDRVGTDYALYDSHTKFEALLTESGLEREREFLITKSGVADYKRHHVLVGLRTAAIDVKDAPGSKVPNDCPGSARSYAQLVQYAADQGLQFTIGSDFNGVVAQLGPRFPGGTGRCYAARRDFKKDRLSEQRINEVSEDEGPLPARARTVAPIARTNYYTHGLATIGWEPELVVDLVDNLHTPGAEQLRDGAERFLQMWERAYQPPGKLPAEPGVARGSVAMGGSCTAGDQCKTGRCTGIAGAKGVCVCNDDADCGEGEFCDAGADLKKNVCLAKKSNNASCAAVNGGHQCRSGHCKSGRCYEPASVAMGGVCFDDGACKEGKCSSIDGVQGTCVCKEDSDCGAGKWCDGGVDFKKNTCHDKLAKGEVCGKVGSLGNDHKCKSGQCGGITKLVCK